MTNDLPVVVVVADVVVDVVVADDVAGDLLYLFSQLNKYVDW